MQQIENMHNWISELPQEIAEEVLSRCATRRLVDGESLWHPGDPADSCYRVLNGRLKVCNVNASGQEMVLSYLIKGDCVGEWGILIDDEVRLNHTYALGDTEVLVLPRSDFHQLYQRYPEIARALNRVMARRMRMIAMLAEDASLLSLSQRLARAIVRLGYNIGSVEGDGKTTIEDISHDELSRIVGATRQSVSRELKKLKDEGDIELSYNRLVISDIKAMAERYDSLVSVEPVVAGYGQSEDPSPGQ